MNIRHRIRTNFDGNYQVETLTIDGEWSPNSEPHHEREDAITHLGQIAAYEMAEVYIAAQDNGSDVIAVAI